MTQRSSRRRFLQASTAAGLAGFWSGALAADKPASPNEKLQVGVIGVAGRGAGNINDLDKAGAAIVALCDVDESRTGDARKRFPNAKFYPDYRKLLEQKGLDAVLIATPDHTHAVATAAALKSNLHVYCEKPLTHTVHECRTVRNLALKHKRVTQMGNQIHASENYRRVVEIIQSGAIGTVSEAHCWVGRPWSGLGKRPTETPPVPAHLHWDLWLGPAKERPYHPCYFDMHWRGWWDFGGGALADMACHHVDLPFWALKLRYPTKVSAEGSPVNPECAAEWTKVTFDFPAREKLPAVKLTWYDGTREGKPNRPALFGEGKLPKWGDGTLFVGDKGMLLANYGEYRLLPEKQFEGYKPPAPTIARSVGHHKEWLEACKSAGTTTCNFDYAGALAETALLGVVAYRFGKPFTWDAENLKSPDAPEIEKYVTKEYRKGWSL